MYKAFEILKFELLRFLNSFKIYKLNSSFKLSILYYMTLILTRNYILKSFFCNSWKNSNIFNKLKSLLFRIQLRNSYQKSTTI